MLLNRIKTLLGITDNDELIHEITELTKSKILNYINKSELPMELEFVLIELSIQRYNRIGSEGIASENVDGKSVSYEADFEGYKMPLPIGQAGHGFLVHKFCVLTNNI